MAHGLSEASRQPACSPVSATRPSPPSDAHAAARHSRPSRLAPSLQAELSHLPQGLCPHLTDGPKGLRGKSDNSGSSSSDKMDVDSDSCLSEAGVCPHPLLCLLFPRSAPPVCLRVSAAPAHAVRVAYPMWSCCRMWVSCPNDCQPFIAGASRALLCFLSCLPPDRVTRNASAGGTGGRPRPRSPILWTVSCGASLAA